MKRPLQLPLAIALALGGTNALALGLGPVHVNSRLNQPLDADIPVIQGTAGEAEGLLVGLAAADDFERIGLSRSRLKVPLEFAVVKGARGEPVIKVTSKEPVRDTYLDFLLEANWPKGRLLREYTILLDPPLVAPATRGATTSPVAAAAPPKAVAREPRPEAAPAPAAPRPRTRPAAADESGAKVAAGDYGPVQAGETLSGIARARGQGGDLNRMMLAIWKQNPDAFYKNNINALKRGAILRIPSAEEVRAVGDAREAAAQVQAQIEDWRGGRATATQVAGADVQAAPAPKKTVAAAAPKPAKAPAGERLELVPPKAGKDSLAMADRPGGGAGSAAAGELKSELARTKEALTAREQETGELKSRVRELEDLKGKNDRLISLKDSEIAELQQKLKALQEKPGAPAEPAKPVSAPKPAEHGDASKSADAPAAVAARPADKIEKKDIWGDAAPTSGTPAASAAAPAATNAATPATSTPAASATPAGNTAAPVAATPPPAEPKPAAPAATATTTPVAPSVNPASPPPAAAPKPATQASTAAPKPAVRKPVPRAPEWYEAPWVIPAAIGAGVLVLLGLLASRRKRKPAPAVSGGSSIADAFGDSPLGPASPAAAAGDDPEEARLLDQLRADPGNTGLRLELLSLYYAARRSEDFERAAEAMREHVVDTDEPEWQEALAMGRELAPHNPLFAAPHDATAFGRIDEEVRHAFGDEPAAPPPARDTSFAFDPDLEHFGSLGTRETTPVPETRALADALDFGLPSFETPAPTSPAGIDDVHVPPPAVEAHLDDGIFGGNDDAIGTKLDLAKAYMDMGDPEGARSMLEEVVAEGSELQRAEAHRLMTELR